MGAVACIAALLAPGAASAGDAPPTVEAAPAAAARGEWEERYEGARAQLLAGEHAAAAAHFDALARDAPSEPARTRALEMADVARALAEREGPTRRGGAGPTDPRIRTVDEISILYASAFLYGAGTGTWFLLQVQPDSAITATLPFAAITALPVIALATIDGRRPLPRGMPHAITAGLYLGLGEALWVTSYQHTRAHRIDGDGPRSTRWQADTVSTVLWTGATLGAITGGALAAGLTTTPGRVSFTASTTVWLGVISGLTASALLPSSAHRGEDASLVAGMGYNVGLFGGMLLAGQVSPSVTRVRLVDLSGAAGALATAGMYLSLAHRDADPHIGVGVAAAGAAAGLAVGTLLTARMGREVPGPGGALQTVSWHPLVMPAPGGAMAGIGGFL